MQIGSIDHVAINCTDIQKSLDFCRDRLKESSKSYEGKKGYTANKKVKK